MTSQSDPPELDRLLSGLCDGTLDAADRRELGRRLAVESDARRRYLQYVDLHAVLAARGPAAPLAEPEPSAPTTARRTLRVPVVNWYGAAAAVAAAVVALTVWVAPRPGDGGRPVAPARAAKPAPATLPQFPPDVRLSQLAGSVLVSGASGDPVAPAAGAVVAPGQTVRTGDDDSLAALDFPDGSRVELAADTQLRLSADAAGGTRMVLSRGLLRADVKPQPAGRPMTVVTPQAEVVVLGTRFTVSAGDATAVETEAGRVRVVRTGDGRGADVPAGHFLVAAADDEADLAVRSVPRLLTEPRAKLPFQRAFALAYSADGRRLTAASQQRLTTMRADTGEALGPAADLGRDVMRVAVSADGTAALVVRRDARLDVYDAAAGALRSSIATDFPTYPQAVAVAPDGTRVAAYEPGRPKVYSVRVWDADAAELASVELAGQARGLAFGPLGDRVAVSAVRPGQFQDRRVTVHRVADGTREATTPPLGRPIDVVAVSPDGRRFAGADERGAVHVWDAATGDWLGSRGPADGWAGRVHSLAFSPDGRLLAAGGADGRVRLWDVAAGRDVATLVCGKRPVWALAFAPDGRTLATGPTASPVLLWDVPAGTPN